MSLCLGIFTKKKVLVLLRETTVRQTVL